MRLKKFILIITFLKLTAAHGLIYGSPEQIINLSPFADSNLLTWRAHQLVFDSLLIEVPGSRDVFRSGLAKSWKISNNKLVYTFVLRNSYWSDGKPLTTEDVKFSFDLITDERFKSPWRATFVGIEKVEISKPNQIRITVKRPDFDLWKNIAVALKIIPSHIYKVPDNLTYSKQMVGSGPYKQLNFSSGARLTLVKNEIWWGFKDQDLKKWFLPEKIILKTILNDSTVENYFIKNEIDVFPAVQQHTGIKKDFSKNSPFYYLKDPNKKTEIIQQLFLNMKNPLFAEREVRSALNLIVEKSQLCHENPSVTASSIDRNKGLNILKKLGWVDSDANGTLDKDGVPFNFEVIYHSKNNEIILTSLKQHLKNYGIGLDLKLLENSLFWKTLTDRNFHSYFDQQDQNEVVLRSVWHSEGFYNSQSFSFRSIDRDIDQLEKTFAPRDRSRLITSLRRRIDEEFPSVMLCKVSSEGYFIHSKYPHKSAKKGLPLWGWYR